MYKLLSSIIAIGLISCMTKNPQPSGGVVTLSSNNDTLPCTRTSIKEKSGITSQFSLCARVDVLLPVGSRSLQPGDTLYLGDQFTISAWANRDVYLYILGYEPTTWSDLLFPHAEAQLVKGQQVIRVPESGRPYVASDTTGEFVIQVYASLQPIDRATCRRLHLRCQALPGGGVGLSRGGGDPDEPASSESEPAADDSQTPSEKPKETKEPKDPPPPDGVPRKERGLVLNYGAERVLVTQASPDGVALLSFPLRHAEKPQVPIP